MSRGHGIIINMVSYAPFIFEFNPESIESTKKINYAIAPNIGGAFKKRYFAGFDAKEVTFKLLCVDMESPTGVMDEISYFEMLREPNAGPLGLISWGSGTQNYPPPQVLFQFGTSYIPLIWDVVDIQITADHFHDGIVRGVIGVPKKAEITISLALDEDNAVNKANHIAKQAAMYAASAKSVAREYMHNKNGKRKEAPGLFGSGTRSAMNRNSSKNMKNTKW